MQGMAEGPTATTLGEAVMPRPRDGITDVREPLR